MPAPPPPSPTSRWLALTVAGLVALIAVSRWSRPSEPETVAAGPPPPAETPSGGPPPAPPAPPQRVTRPTLVVQPPAPTPVLDLLVRLEAGRRIQRAGAAVYLDSLLAESDSLLRRWPDRPGQPITIAFVRDSLFAAARVDERPIRDGFARWAEVPIGLQFTFVADSTNAEILVQWIDRFNPEERRTGETNLEMAPTGAIHHATITLALRDPTGALLDARGLAMAAVHEVGHALGLGHSALPGDVMFPSPRSTSLSVRDRRTAELIYGLPPGSVKTGNQD